MESYRYNIGVIKVGSDVAEHPRAIEHIARQVHYIRENGLVRSVALVASGAVSKGISRLTGKYNFTPGQLTTVQKQVVSSKGEAAKFREYEHFLDDQNTVALQVPISWMDFHRAAFRNYMHEVLRNPQFVPVVNENDVACDRELHPDHANERYQFDDNDELFSLLSREFNADIGLVLSNVNGLRNDVDDEDSLISTVSYGDTIWEEVCTSKRSNNGTGTMKGKCYQISLMAEKGILVGLVDGREDSTIIDFIGGQPGNRPGTTFLPKEV